MRHLRWPVRHTIAVLLLATSATRAADPQITEFVLRTEGNRPESIICGKDGNLYVTEINHNKVFRITPTGQITELPATDRKMGKLQGIAEGGAGALYLTTWPDNAIWKMSPDGKFSKSVDLQAKAVRPNRMNQGAWPRGIVVDGDIWFAEMAANKVGKLGGDGKVTEFQLPTPEAGPYAVIVGPDKKIWFSERAANKIGRLDPATGKIDEFKLPTRAAMVSDLCVGPDRAIWFTENQAHQIGRITVEGKITEFPVRKNAWPFGIAAGGDGNIWFAEEMLGKIGRITPQGQITEFDLPTKGSRPFGCCADKEGNVWFTVLQNRIVRVNLKAER